MGCGCCFPRLNWWFFFFLRFENSICAYFEIRSVVSSHQPCLSPQLPLHLSNSSFYPLLVLLFLESNPPSPMWAAHLGMGVGTSPGAWTICLKVLCRSPQLLWAHDCDPHVRSQGQQFIAFLPILRLLGPFLPLFCWCSMRPGLSLGVDIDVPFRAQSLLLWTLTT